MRKEGKRILCTKYYYIRASVLVIISVTLFLSSWTMKYLFISVILRAGSHEIKSKIVNCRMCLVAKGVRRRM